MSLHSDNCLQEDMSLHSDTETTVCRKICHSTRTLKQLSAGRYVTPLGHIIMIPTQAVIALVTSNLQLNLILS